MSKHAKNTVVTVFSGFVEVPGPSCGPGGGSLMLMMLAPVRGGGGGVPPQNLRYKVVFRMFAQRQRAESMMRAGSRIMSPPGRLAALQKRRKAWYLRCFRHFHAFAFGTPLGALPGLPPEPHARNRAKTGATGARRIKVSL